MVLRVFEIGGFSLKVLGKDEIGEFSQGGWEVQPENGIFTKWTSS